LFKHELAFVLGQLEDPSAVKVYLEDVREDSIVCHEFANFKSLKVFPRFLTDPEPIVQESCLIALDMHQYKKSEEFQYADGVSRVALVLGGINFLLLVYDITNSEWYSVFYGI